MIRSMISLAPVQIRPRRAPRSNRLPGRERVPGLEDSVAFPHPPPPSPLAGWAGGEGASVCAKVEAGSPRHILIDEIEQLGVRGSGASCVVVPSRAYLFL